MLRKQLNEGPNRKLRLLVTTKCPNKCPMCCNNSWDFEGLLKVSRWDYDEIMLTGGEPLLFTKKACELVRSLRMITEAQGLSPKIFIYTSVADRVRFFDILREVDGVVLTPHGIHDVKEFVETNYYISHELETCRGKSLRLNLFNDIKKLLPENIDLSAWQVKPMEWIKDCPVPEGEDFRRIAKLWE